jgi:hypothetical protein
MVAGIPYPHRAYRHTSPKGPELRSRKGNGNIARTDKAEREEVAGRPDGQGKAGMVNAKLRELQSVWRISCAAVKAIDTPHRSDEGHRPVTLRSSQTDTVLIGKIRMSGAPNPAVPHGSRDYEIAYSRLSNGPVWRRSHHSTQMLGVMSETAPTTTGDGHQQRTSRPHKPGATPANLLIDGGRMAASLQPNVKGAC